MSFLKKTKKTQGNHWFNPIFNPKKKKTPVTYTEIQLVTGVFRGSWRTVFSINNQELISETGYKRNRN